MKCQWDTDAIALVVMTVPVAPTPVALAPMALVPNAPAPVALAPVALAPVLVPNASETVALGLVALAPMALAGGCWLKPKGPNFPEGGAARFRMAPTGTVLARADWTLPDNCSQGWGSSLVFIQIGFQA